LISFGNKKTIEKRWHASHQSEHYVFILHRVSDNKQLFEKLLKLCTCFVIVSFSFIFNFVNCSIKYIFVIESCTSNKLKTSSHVSLDVLQKLIWNTWLLSRQFTIIINACVSFCWNSSLFPSSKGGKWWIVPPGVARQEISSISKLSTILDIFLDFKTSFMLYFQMWKKVP